MALLGAFMVPHPPIAVPEVGRGEEAKIRGTEDSFRRVARRLKELAPDTVILSSPHNILYADYFNIPDDERAAGDLSQFRAPSVRADLPADTALIDEICRRAGEAGIPAGPLGTRDHSLDHGCMVPLSFILKEYQDFKLVRVGLSGLPLAQHYRLGRLIRGAADALGRRAVWIGSGDLSHKLREDGPYGFDPSGPVYDERIMDVMGRAAFGELFDFGEGLCEKAAECGHRSFVLMAGALDRCAVRAERLTHEDIFGVGYGFCMYTVTGDDPSRDFLDQYAAREKARLAERRRAEDGFVRLARRALEAWILSGRTLRIPEDLPPDLTEAERTALLDTRAGAFVSLHEEGALRGCIGTISAVRSSLAEEICENAVSACSRDPRFDPVEPDELDRLEYSVDVLADAEPIASPAELDPARYGVIVEKHGRRGLLLPNLDGVDTVEDQIAIACRKAGLRPGEPGIRLSRFEVVRHY